MKKTDIRISNLFEQFIFSRMASGAKDITIKSYRGHFKSFQKYLDEKDMLISSFTKDHIEHMIVKMREAHLSSVTIQTYTRTLKIFLNWVEANGFPTPMFKIYHANLSLKEPYSDQEIKHLLAAPPSNCDFWELRGWTIISFLLNSGCRCATLRSILIRDLDFDTQLVSFRHTKNGQPQIIPLCNDIVPILQRYLSIRGGLLNEPLFCNDHFQYYSQSALRKAVIKYNQSRGVEKTSIHLFRHTFAKNYILRCGGDPFTLQFLLGHKSLEMTKRYCLLYNADVYRHFNDICPLHNLLTV